MRAYTNKHGEKVELSDNHLDVSIEIMEELQKASPSRRCNWAKHKRMMVEEGFDESENSESYRQCIKFERSKRGVLPEMPKYAELVSDNKIETIRKEIGEIRSTTLEAQQSFNALNKMKREWNRELLIVEGIERAVEKLQLPKAPVVHKKIKASNRTLLVGLSDLHYGSVVDVEGYTYNAEICEEYLVNYLAEIVDLIERENISDVQVIMMGDLIEQIYMRNTQAYNVEKLLSEQIVESAQLVFSFIEALTEYANVSYAGFNGNHDRINGNKNDSIYGDGVVSIANGIIKSLARARECQIEYIETEPYHYLASVHGRNFLFVHGDKTSIKKSSILAEQSMVYGVQLDALLAGHIHHFTMEECGDNKFVTTFGSIKGTDEYSLKTVGSTSSRSQGVIIVDDEGFEIKRIAL